MTLCLLVCGFVVFGLYVGWDWFIQHRAERETIRQFSLRKEAEAKRKAAESAEMIVPASDAAAAADGMPRVSLTDIAKDSQSASPEVPRETVTISLSLDNNSPDVQQADDLLDRYLRTANWKDRLQYVYQAERVAPQMANFYEKQKGSDPATGALLNRGRYRLDGTEILHFTYSCNRPGDVLELAMKRDTSGKFVLDWESYVGYSEMSWADFKKERSTKAMVFRAFATLSDYYNYEFGDRGKYVSVNLLSPDGLVSLHGYCERQSALGTAITRALGRASQITGLTLRLAYPERAESDHCLAIKQMVSDRWLLLP